MPWQNGRSHPGPQRNFYFVAKANTLADNRQRELLNRLDQISKELANLQTEMARLEHVDRGSN